MTSPQHALWIRRGGQWQLAIPLAALRDRLRRYGYTVYDIGNDAHLDHLPPEDHTPYSETGWPGTTPYGWVTAIDIMPPPGGSGLPNLQQLGRQLHDDRNAGVPGVAWLKYLNWGPDNDRGAIHCQWTPGHVQRISSDTGHIHASGRSDHVVAATPAELAYDPVARLRGIDEQEEETMGKQELVQGFAPDPEQIWLCDGVFRRKVTKEWVYGADGVNLDGPISNNQVHQESHLGQLANGGAVFVSGGDPDVWGVDVSTLGTNVDTTALAAALLADPAFVKALAEAAFQGSQRAERE